MASVTLHVISTARGSRVSGTVFAHQGEPGEPHRLQYAPGSTLGAEIDRGHKRLRRYVASYAAEVRPDLFGDGRRFRFDALRRRY